MSEKTSEQRDFFAREARTVSKDEYESYITPYECQARVMASIDSWQATAQKYLEISEDPAEIGEAQVVLAAIRELRREIFRNPKNLFLLIEQAIYLGVVVTQAHTLQFEAPYRIGEEFKNSQRQKASLPRSVLTAVIDDLAVRKDELGDYLPVKGLFTELYGWLDEHEHEPREFIEAGQTVIAYDDGSGHDVNIKFTSFKSMVSRKRTKS